MNPNERYVSLVKELINGVDAGDFDNIEAIPEKYMSIYIHYSYLQVHWITGKCCMSRYMTLLSGMEKEVFIRKCETVKK